MTGAARKRVLVVDDAGLVRLYYREALESAGFEVEEALNGLEALEKLDDLPMDLMILDVNMPQMDGLTFLKALRSRTDLAASIPVVVISSESKQSDKDNARSAGANFYVVKPAAQNTLTALALLLSGAANG
jgi:two-component system chemotaxis response regulator CheY